MDFNYYIFIPKPKSSDRDLDPLKTIIYLKKIKEKL